MTERPRRLMLQRTGPAFEQGRLELMQRTQHNTAYAVVERRILIEANTLLTEHIPHLSAAVRCALRQALGKPNG